MFKVGDKVIIKGNDNCYIGGIYNNVTPIFLYYLFDIKLHITSYWKSELTGDIFKVGKDNHYIIRDGNNYYLFSNRYEEMKLQKIVSKKNS